MNTNHLRIILLLGAAVGALLSALIDYPFNVGTFGFAALSFFPLLLATLWYLAGSSDESRIYGRAAAASTVAALVIPLSITFGPALSVLAGLTALALTKKDLFYFLAAAAALISVLLANGSAGQIAGLPSRYAHSAPPAEIVYTCLAVVLITLAVLIAATTRASRTEADTDNREHQEANI